MMLLTKYVLAGALLLTGAGTASVTVSHPAQTSVDTQATINAQAQGLIQQDASIATGHDTTSPSQNGNFDSDTFLNSSGSVNSNVDLDAGNLLKVNTGLAGDLNFSL